MAECPGLYHLAQMKDGGLARLRVPGQHLTLFQLRTVCDAANLYGNGIVEITQRGNLQIRGLPQTAPQGFLEAFKEAQLLAPQNCDRIRNVTVDPLSDLWPGEANRAELINCQPFACALCEHLCVEPAFAQFDVKFSFLLDGGSPLGLIHLKSDMGVLARRFNTGTGEVKFQLFLAGEPTDLFLKKNELGKTLAELALMAFDYGGQTSFRMRDLMGSRDELLERLARHPNVDQDSRPEGYDAVSQHMQAPFGMLALKDHYGLCVQGTEQRFHTHSLKGFLKELESIGIEGVRLSPSKHLIIVTKTKVQASRVKAAALAQHYFCGEERQDVRLCACAGSAGCEKGLFETGPMTKALLDGFKDMKMKAGSSGQTLVHISACTKGCAYGGTADFLIVPSQKSDGAYALYKNQALPFCEEEPQPQPSEEFVGQDTLLEILTGLLNGGS